MAPKRKLRVRRADTPAGMLTYREALTRAADQLSAHPDLRPTAFADATVLFQHAIGITRSTLMAHPDRRIDREQQAFYQRTLERRLRFEPIQYILGETEFYGHTLRVTPAVLIPRPETEHLVEAVLARVSYREPLRILDVGTGSGAISIALAHKLSLVSVTAVDLSLEALAIARENVTVHNLANRISLRESDLFSALEAGALFDVVVSNPPYVPESDGATLHPQVRDHEPAEALFAGKAGLDVYQRLIPQARQHLVPGGLLALEIGFGQQPAIAALLVGWDEVEFLPDLQDIPRVALARR